ncbi:hypothetical protein [Herbaspirillum frisingense]|uniref:Vacuolar-type H+-ATPase subunit I/STV1 n=1 Tax=Herbaspirillum frisingense TaxID=92645 RepID=A0ABU1PKA4_9BURK|nr:hypothetical protein [Herbaspirillum frisingense]MDR6586364.1 vacuolar-type H+-ATPase subunit I/STV1 [Herbaspirillum frisingense]
MSERGPRRPSIAALNKSNAKNNIVRKKNILDAWARNGIPHVAAHNVEPGMAAFQLEYFPRTIRQFNFWDGSANSEQMRNELPTFTRNANDTLRGYPDLKNSVGEVIDAVKQRAIVQQSRCKETKISSLLSQKMMEKKLRLIAERELVNVRKQQKEERRSYNDETAGLNSQLAELRRQIEKLRTENKDANHQIAGLKVKLAKVAPLKKV